jgi:hypothetical protein
MTSMHRRPILNADMTNDRRRADMRVKLNHFAPLLASAATAVAVAFAPVAMAAPSQGAGGAGGAAAPSDTGQGQQSCVTLGGTASQCQSPGNAQIYDGLPQPDYFPYAGGAT